MEYNNMDNNNVNRYQTGQEKLDSDSIVQQVISKTFLFMFVALLVTAASAYWALSSGFMYNMLTSNTFMILLIVEVAVVFAANATIQKNNIVLSATLFTVYSIINGITLSVIFVMYEMGSIVSIFVLAAAVFATMAVFGLVTKKDLSQLGTIGMMGLFGIIALGLANLFIKSESLSIGIAAVGLAVFIGLTAYDIQKIKNMARSNIGLSTNSLALFGAMTLYLDFVNIFLKLLRLFGKKR